MKIFSKICFTAALSAFAFTAQAIEVSPSFSLGLEFGGDKIFEATLTDGTKRSMNAGGVALLSVGADIHPVENLPLKTRVALGFKAAGVEAQNGKYDFFRWLFEASEHYRFAQLPIEAGIGTTLHFSNKVNTSGILAAYATDIDPSAGFFVQADYFFSMNNINPMHVDSLSLGLRYTLQSYEKKATGTKVAANAFGFQFRTLW